MAEEVKTLEQLKAEAYDCLVQVESWQLKLREVNTKIAELQKKPA